jgi:hypothetical protein
MKLTALLGIGLALWVIDVPGDGLPVRSANAIIGAPLTPVSAAGVARRTTRRVVATEAAVATTAATSAAAASATAASAPPPPPPATPTPAIPVGTVVSALPPNCAPAAINGVEYSYCGGVYYRAGFQGNNVVYVVSRP